MGCMFSNADWLLNRWLPRLSNYVLSESHVIICRSEHIFINNSVPVCNSMILQISHYHFGVQKIIEMTFNQPFSLFRKPSTLHVTALHCCWKQKSVMFPHKSISNVSDTTSNNVVKSIRYRSDCKSNNDTKTHYKNLSVLEFGDQTDNLYLPITKNFITDKRPADESLKLNLFIHLSELPCSQSHFHNLGWISR